MENVEFTLSGGGASKVDDINSYNECRKELIAFARRSDKVREDAVGDAIEAMNNDVLDLTEPTAPQPTITVGEGENATVMENKIALIQYSSFLMNSAR